MPGPLFANNAACFLTSGVASGATSISLPTGKGVLFPAPTGGDYFMLTLEDIAAGLREIVKVTARSGDVLTVVRAQEGTTARTFAPTTTAAAHRLTAGVLTLLTTLSGAIVNTFGALTDTFTLAGNGLKDVRVNSAATALEPYTAPYDVGIFIGSTMTASEVVLRFATPRAFTLPAGAAGSYAIAAVAATASTTLNLAKNGSNFGTIVFAVAGTVATITIGSTTSFAAGDVLSLTAPATPDATLANIAVTLAGSRA